MGLEKYFNFREEKKVKIRKRKNGYLSISFKGRYWYGLRVAEGIEALLMAYREEGEAIETV